MMRSGTAHYDNLSIRVVKDQFPYDFSAIRFTFGGNGTGIDDHEIGTVPHFSLDVPLTQKCGTNGLRFILIDFAAESEKTKNHCTIVSNF